MVRMSRWRWGGVVALALVAVVAGVGVASTPGTNGRLVYSQEVGRHFQLFTVRPDGTDKTQLTHYRGADAVNPDWSPDGSRLVFELGSDKGAGIVVAAADGSGAQNLTPNGFQGQPAFSPDGQSIVFERDIGPANNGLFVMAADGSGVRRLTRNPFHPKDSCGCDTDPNFSPDGKTVTFVRSKHEDDLQALFSIGIDGRNLRRLTPYKLEVAIKHDWSPDGRLIVLTTQANPEPGKSANLATIRPDGTRMRRLTRFNGKRNAFAGSFSPDGKQIVFRLERGAKYSLATIKRRGGKFRKLTTSRQSPRFIDWGTHP
jgi:Tol biopolymer transport system component